MRYPTDVSGRFWILLLIGAAAYAISSWIDGRAIVNLRWPAASPPPSNVTLDGRILTTGRYERWLRVLAGLAALQPIAWVAVCVSSRTPAYLRGTPGAVERLFIYAAVVGIYVVVIGAFFVALARRAAGRVDPIGRNPEKVWPAALSFNMLALFSLDWTNNLAHRILTVTTAVSSVLIAVGWRLERKQSDQSVPMGQRIT